MVDRAKGILMDRHGMTEQDAFSFIQKRAMAARTKMKAVAEQVVRRRPVAVSKLLLLDGNSLTYRAFFALPTDMATASGQVTNAVFGFTSMLINLLRDNRPDGVVVAFDRPEPTFRHEARPRLQGQPRRRRPTSSASRWAWCARWSRRSASSRSTSPGSRPTTSSPPSPTRPKEQG